MQSPFCPLITILESLLLEIIKKKIVKLYIVHVQEQFVFHREIHGGFLRKISSEDATTPSKKKQLTNMIDYLEKRTNKCQNGTKSVVDLGNEHTSL